MLKAILFDMDGVIVDTEPTHLKALIQVGAEFNLTLTPEYCTQFIGRSIHSLMDTLVNDFNLSEREANVAEFRTTFITTFEARKQQFKSIELIPIEGTIRLIQTLHDHNIKVAIASSSTIPEIEFIIESLHLSPYIDCYVSGTMVPESKPHPAIFLLACETLGISPAEAIILEDSENGTIAAHRANIPCIGFKNVNSGNQNLRLACCVVEDTAHLDYDCFVEEYCRFHKLPVEITTTSRLIVRELSLDDIPALYDMYQLPSATTYITPMDSLSEELEKHEAYMKHVYGFYRYGLWGVFLKDTGELIGRCGLKSSEVNESSEIELGYFISPNHQHNGYALEAMTSILTLAKEYYDFSSVVALIDPENKASCSLATKLGLQLDTTCTKDGQNYLVYRIAF